MDWEFTEDAAFLALCDAFRESGESSAIEFLANGEGAFHFQDLAQNAAGEGIYGVDSEGRTTFLNPIAEELLGWSKEDLFGKNIHTTIHQHI